MLTLVLGFEHSLQHNTYVLQNTMCTLVNFSPLDYPEVFCSHSKTTSGSRLRNLKVDLTAIYPFLT